MSMKEINFGKLTRKEIQDYTGKIFTDEQWLVFSEELSSLVTEFIDEELKPLTDDIDQLVEEAKWWASLKT